LAVGYIGKGLLIPGSIAQAYYLHHFLPMVVNHSEVQRKAKEEPDQVVGSERIPDVDDIPNLLYVRAVVQEVHRFCPILTLSVNYRARGEVFYQRYRILSTQTATYCPLSASGVMRQICTKMTSPSNDSIYFQSVRGDGSVLDTILPPSHFSSSPPACFDMKAAWKMSKEGEVLSEQADIQHASMARRLSCCRGRNP